MELARASADLPAPHSPISRAALGSAVRQAKMRGGSGTGGASWAVSTAPSGER